MPYSRGPSTRTSAVCQPWRVTHRPTRMYAPSAARPYLSANSKRCHIVATLPRASKHADLGTGLVLPFSKYPERLAPAVIRSSLPLVALRDVIPPARDSSRRVPGGLHLPTCVVTREGHHVADATANSDLQIRSSITKQRHDPRDVLTVD